MRGVGFKMEKVNFTNNVEFVKAARELFTNDYRLSVIFSENGEAINCAYRLSKEGVEEPARCLIGRMFYGYISEDHDFWNYGNDIIHAREEFEILNELFPWLDDEVASEIQAYHDSRAGLCHTDLCGWDTLELMAHMADLKYEETRNED